MKLWTKKKVLVLCCLIPALLVAIYAWSEVTEEYVDADGNGLCEHVNRRLERIHFIVWTTLYLYLPGILLFSLSIAIAVKMRQIQKTHSELARSSPANTT